MMNGRRANGAKSSRIPAGNCWLESAEVTRGVRYVHILVPTSLNLVDRPALRWGLELAALHQAALTVLHVVPNNEFEVVAHGLDSIGLLYRAADELTADAWSHGNCPVPNATRSRVYAFLNKVIPDHRQDEVDLRVACRRGDVAETIARFADESDADLVIMSSRPPRWWWPILPAAVRGVLRLARPQLILFPRGEKCGQEPPGNR